jgi:hypothetical protein
MSDGFDLTMRCQQDFDAMPRQGAGRLCAQCSEVVTDLSAMTYAQYMRWMRELPPGPMPCVRVRLDMEGRAVVRPDPAPPRALPVLPAALAAALSATGPACQSKPPTTSEAPVRTQSPPLEGGLALGAMGPDDGATSPSSADDASPSAEELRALLASERDRIADGGTPRSPETSAVIDGGGVLRVLHPHPPNRHLSNGAGVLGLSNSTVLALGGGVSLVPQNGPTITLQGTVSLRVDSVGDGLDASGVQRNLRRVQSQLRARYEVALRQNPDLRGTVQMRFTIGSNGRVTGAPAVTQDIPGSTVAAMLAGIVQRTVFQPPDNDSVEVRLTIVLERREPLAGG